MAIVKWMVEEAGADPTARDDLGRMAAHFANKAGKGDVARYLRQACAAKEEANQAAPVVKVSRGACLVVVMTRCLRGGDA